jgi:hypothetical protein
MRNTVSTTQVIVTAPTFQLNMVYLSCSLHAVKIPTAYHLARFGQGTGTPIGPVDNARARAVNI